MSQHSCSGAINIFKLCRHTFESRSGFRYDPANGEFFGGKITSSNKYKIKEIEFERRGETL